MSFSLADYKTWYTKCYKTQKKDSRVVWGNLNHRGIIIKILELYAKYLNRHPNTKIFV
jgi:hypothetical protein